MFRSKKTAPTAQQLHGTPWTLSWDGNEWHPVNDAENVVEQLEHAVAYSKGPITLRYEADTLIVTDDNFQEACRFIYSHS